MDFRHDRLHHGLPSSHQAQPGPAPMTEVAGGRCCPCQSQSRDRSSPPADDCGVARLSTLH
eukprot:3320611-Heterocapsa_arctica.AAC.1